MTKTAANVPIRAPFENCPAWPSFLGGGEVGDVNNDVGVVIIVIGIVVVDVDHSVVPEKLDLGGLDVGRGDTGVVGPP